MLRVRLELVPFGDEDRKHEIGQLVIFNKGLDCMPNFYKYGVIQMDSERNTGGMFRHPILHRRSRGAWALVERALSDLVNKEIIDGK